jgi:hypothetical protein
MLQEAVAQAKRNSAVKEEEHAKMPVPPSTRMAPFIKISKLMFSSSQNTTSPPKSKVRGGAALDLGLKI